MYRAGMAREASWPQPASWMSLKLPAEKFLEIAKLPCFPFFLVYRVMDARVEVIAVAHGHRQPEYWQERL
jgi:hypothetical protein